MKEGIISFRFKSEKAFDSVKFVGEAIGLADLKRNIEEKRIRRREVEVGKKWESYELLIYEENNKKSRFLLDSEYINESEQVPTNSSIIIERVPVNAINYLSNFKAKKEDDQKVSSE